MEEKHGERVDRNAQEQEKERVERELEAIAEMSGESLKKVKSEHKKQNS